MQTKGRRIYLLSLLVGLSILCSIILATNGGLVTAPSADPNFYYYSGGRKNALALSQNRLAVRFKKGIGLETQDTIMRSEENLMAFVEREESPTFRLTFAPLRENMTEADVIQTLNRLNSKPEVEVACAIFEFPDAEAILTDEFNVRFAPEVSQDEIDAFNLLHDVEIASKPEWTELYTLRVKDPTNMNTLETANRYYESKLTLFSLPNFVGRSEKAVAISPNDTYFEEQWPLDNTGFNSGETPGTLDADIDAPEGWSTSTGNSDIVIAIIDTGVDLTHEDLENKLVDGYDSLVPDNDPSPGDPTNEDNAHGTACAGLAAAETNNNEIGIAGVAWGCKIMPIRVLSKEGTQWIYSNASFANGITWAANKGADVLSNSWMNPFGDNDDVHNAIIDAKNNGRGGKGCVILFCSHNHGGSVVYPAKYPEVIAVGATDHNDERWDIGPGDGSNFGPELDVVAPTGWLGQGVIMWSTDISGEGGYNPGDPDEGDDDGDYYKWFGGTSAATPEVAGLAGLILSVNPDLTADEVQFIIESTADDVDESGGWDEEYGWGRINNESALLKAGSFSIDDTLFGWLKFDETTDDTAYDSINNNNGTLNNFPTDDSQWVTGKINGALDFDGINDYVKLDHAVDALKAGPVTISAWIKADDVAAGLHPIVSTYYYDNPNHYGYFLFLSGDAPFFYLAGSEVQSGVSINTSDWYHLAGTYDGSNLKIYVNGGEPETNPQSGLTGYYEPYDDTYIGYEDDIDAPLGVYFDGKIDDVRVYRRALSMFEIWDAMSGDLPRFRVKNSSDETVAWFDSFGNLILKGSLTERRGQTRPTATDDDEFIFKDSIGNLMIINTTNGNMDIYREHLAWQPPSGENDFIFEDSEGAVAYIDELGNLYLEGELYENPE